MSAEKIKAQEIQIELTEVETANAQDLTEGKKAKVKFIGDGHVVCLVEDETNINAIKKDHTPHLEDWGGKIKLTRNDLKKCVIEWKVTGGRILDPNKDGIFGFIWDTTGITGYHTVTAKISVKESEKIEATPLDADNNTIKHCEVAKLASTVTCKVSDEFFISPRRMGRGDTQPVTMRRTSIPQTPDLALWAVIRKSTEALSYENYNKFLNTVLCRGNSNQNASLNDEYSKLRKIRALPYTDIESYRLLKTATEAFLVVNSAIELKQNFTEDNVNAMTRRLSTDSSIEGINNLWEEYLEKINGTKDTILPYLELIRKKFPESDLKFDISEKSAKKDSGGGQDDYIDCYGVIKDKLRHPCMIELIWNYWHEEGALVQTMNAITQRFANVRSHTESNPLANLETDPLRPVNNMLWGYIQDEQHRLSVIRRVYEYNHQYGLSLIGKAIPEIKPADSRSKFIEAFHNLLNLCAAFYSQDDDTTVIADGFMILNGLREVHLLLSEGAHNQYGDLPFTARQEMLMQQWMLARPEFREFLPTRIMVAYPEPWMDRVDAMKKIQGWSDTSVLHFSKLATFGEQLLLSARFNPWNAVDEPNRAANWARYWRAEVQGYIHSYRAVSGVDLTSSVETTPPSVLLRKRLLTQTKKIA